MTPDELGSKQAFPIQAFPPGWVFNPSHIGMTYRQWLIGMALSGGAHIHDEMSSDTFADMCILVADAAIAIQCKEQP
jgi:hypothetical protein